MLVGEATWRLVRGTVRAEPTDPLTLKGKAEPVVAYRVLGLVEGAEAIARRLDSPLVGRRRELEQLVNAFRRASEERSCHLCTVIGPAGIGKTRLIAELLAQVEGQARVVRGRCLSYGEGITYWPAIEIVRAGRRGGRRRQRRGGRSAVGGAGRRDRFGLARGGSPV